MSDRIGHASARLLRLLLGVSLAGIAPGTHAAHAIALYGEPKYGADFTHLDYLDPAAPKQGTLYLANSFESNSFDKLNPYSVKGKAPPGLLELVFETLAVHTFDEQVTQYGLLARDIALAEDLTSVTFTLDPRARFSNGDPVTAEDVRHSFLTLSGPASAPRFRLYFADIADAVVVDALTVRLEFVRPSRELALIAGALPVFSQKWGLHADGSRIAFEQLQFEPPIASGPYVVEKADTRRGVLTYARDRNYWAADLPLRRGAFNFDQVVYRMYRDYDLQVEAFKAGEFDVIVEGKARNWCCVYTGERFARGERIKALFPHRNTPGMNGYVFNLRHARFQDVRVRKALSYALDFDWINKNVFYGEYQYPDSYFANSEFAATGVPTQAEIDVLEPFRAQLDPAVFGPMVERPRGNLRDNLILGQALLEEAGWTYRDGALRNAAGEIFTVQSSVSEGIPLPRIETFLRNLSRYGIRIVRKSGDPVASRLRMQDFDFDLSMIAFRESRIPGNDMQRKLGSAEADTPGSENIIGVKSPVIDALIAQLSNAADGEQLTATARALDRVLMHGYYVVPERYSFEHRVAYDTRLGHPEPPLYYTPIEWVLSAWWQR